jgi:hypothetical protein
MKKYLPELSMEELKKVYDVNKELRDIVYDMEYESGKVYIEDIMYEFKDAGAIQSYSIELAGRSNYIKVIDKYKFFDKLLSFKFSNNIKDKNEVVFELAQDGIDLVTARDTVKIHGKVYEMLDDKLDDVLKNVTSHLTSLLTNFLEYNEENYIMFDEYVNHHEEFDEVYIKDDTYIAYKDIVKDYR